MCVCVCVHACVCESVRVCASVCVGGWGWGEVGGGVCVMSKVASIKVINCCDPLKLHYEPLGFQQPSLHAISDCPKS